MTDWEKWLDRRKANIGFATKVGAFRDPTKSELNSALDAEIKSWQDSKGKKNYKVGESYLTSVYKKGEYGLNLKADRLAGEPIKGAAREAAIKAYLETPIDPHGILRAAGINIEQYESKKGFFTRIKNWFKYTFMEPKPTTKYWYTADEEFVKKWSSIIKEKK